MVFVMLHPVDDNIKINSEILGFIISSLAEGHGYDDVFVYVPNKQVAELGDRTVTVKSILNIMAAGIKYGTEVEVRCDGENEEADLKTLVDLIESGLGE